MKKSNYTEEQIAFALKQAELGAPISEVCRKFGIAEQTFYRQKSKFDRNNLYGISFSLVRKHRNYLFATTYTQPHDSRDCITS